MARQPLGRGLSALLGEDTASTAAAVAHSSSGIDIDLIDTNPQQPRERFNDTDLDQLAASIKANGVVQPIVVRRNGDRFQIVAGERRWRASQRAGLRRIPAVVRDVPDDKLLELALIENIQRQELNPIEEANAYRRLVENIGLTQEMLADRVGKDRTIITTSMRLLKLANDVQDLIAEGRLSAGHGRALLMSNDSKVQRAVANEAADRKLSVRETEKLIKRVSKGSQNVDNKRVASNSDPNVKVAETKLMRRFGTAVKIIPGKKGTGGKIELEYYGVEDLDRIYQLLMSP
jgi:ParB family chromosome partitioning protein